MVAFTIFIVVMVSQEYMYVKVHHVVYGTKFINKTVKKNRFTYIGVLKAVEY